MRTLFTYIMVFPRRSAFVLLALLIAGIAEGLSLTALLPLLSIAVGESSGSSESGIGKFMETALQNIGIEPTLDAILIIIVGGMFFKGLVLLIANRQVGYTVAHVATALRLDLIEALLASRWQYYLRQPVGSLANSVATEAYRAANGFEHSVNVLALDAGDDRCVVALAGCGPQVGATYRVSSVENRSRRSFSTDSGDRRGPRFGEILRAVLQLLRVSGVSYLHRRTARWYCVVRGGRVSRRRRPREDRSVSGPLPRAARGHQPA